MRISVELLETKDVDQNHPLIKEAVELIFAQHTAWQRLPSVPLSLRSVYVQGSPYSFSGYVSRRPCYPVRET